jgi:F-type H+-transporting ATPase subunit epsilon
LIIDTFYNISPFGEIREGQMKLEILTPDKKVFEGEVTSVTVPGAQGSFEILNNHAPIISILDDGKVIVRGDADKEQKFYTTGGVVEVIGNKVILLAEGIKEK